MNLKQAKQVLVRTHIAALSAGVRANAVEMKSGPGVGKSSMVVQACAEMAQVLGEPVGLVIEMLATIQSVDVRGFMIPQKAPEGGLQTVFSTPPWYPVRANTTVFAPDGVVHSHGSWDGPIPSVGIVFLDEFAQAEVDTSKAAAELLLHGQVGTFTLPVGWRVLAASNRMSDRAGVIRPLTFVINRRMELPIEALLQPWNEWVDSQPAHLRPHHLTVSFANKEPSLVFRDEVPPGDGPFCTPRTLVLMDRDLQALRTEEDVANDKLPMDNIAREVCAGWLGGAESAQYFAHIRFADLLPDISDVLKTPMSAKLPDGRDGQMVAAYMLIAHITSEKAVEPIMKYIARMHIDMQILAMTTVARQQDKAKLVMHNISYTNWMLANKDVYIAASA